MGIDAQTQTDSDPIAPQQHSSPPPSETLRAKQIRQHYCPPHQLNSPDTTHAGSAALLAAQHSSSPTAWKFEGNAGAIAAASLARAQSKPIEAWKPDKLSSAGAAASLAHRTNVNERSVPKDASASAATALQARPSFESHEPSPLAISSAGASLTNSVTHAMRAASMAHKPSLSKSPEQSKTLPSHALKAASAADRDSTVAKSTSPTYYRSPEDTARIQQLDQELANRDLSRTNALTGGVSRSDLTRVATISMTRKQASDQAEQEKADARKRRVEEEAISEYKNQQDLDNATKRLVAVRIARVTLTGEEGGEVLAEKAAGESINRGNERIRDWERILQSLEDENKSDEKRNMGWLRQGMRGAHIEPNRNDLSVLMATAQRNVNSRLDQMDKIIAQEQMISGKPTGEILAKLDASAKDLEHKGTADLERKQKERASTYDIGGMIMTHEQVEAIAQKHVNEVLAGINENVEREKERIETERIERETKLREKQLEQDLARERAAEEKADKDRIKSEQRQQKAEEKRVKTEAKLAEKKKKEDEKIAQKESKTIQTEQLTVAEGLTHHDSQNNVEAELGHRGEEDAKDRTINEGQGDQRAVSDLVSEFDAQIDQEGFSERVEEESQASRKSTEVQAAVGGALELNAQKDQETLGKQVERDLPAGREFAEVREDQAAAGAGVLEHGAPKDHEAYRKSVEERPASGRELEEAQNEQAPVAEVSVHPDAALDDAKGRGIKFWLKEKKDKIGKRLGRHKSPTQAESKESEDEDEDLYGEQLPTTSNWRETPHTREDSLRNVVLAKHEDSDVERKESEPVEQTSAEHTVEHKEESGDEEFNDAEENFESEEPASSSLAIKEKPRKVSSELGSRFKEEF